MTNIALVSVFNKPELADQMVNSAKICSGNCTCLYVTIDNQGNGAFSSAAAAYNAVLDKGLDAEVFIFCHQDVIFLNSSIQEIYQLCRKNPQTLYGAAGVENIGHGEKSRIISSMAIIQQGWNYKTLPKGSTRDVFSLDECLICGNRKVFQTLRFDEQVCDGWHLYAAEFCMQCHLNGIGVKVFDADIVHLSGGNLDKSFYQCEKRIVKKYRNVFPMISYTCGWSYTDPVRYFLLTVYRKIRYHI